MNKEQAIKMADGLVSNWGVDASAFPRYEHIDDSWQVAINKFGRVVVVIASRDELMSFECLCLEVTQGIAHHAHSLYAEETGLDKGRVLYEEIRLDGSREAEVTKFSDEDHEEAALADMFRQADGY